MCLDFDKEGKAKDTDEGYVLKPKNFKRKKTHKKAKKNRKLLSIGKGRV